MAWIQAHLVTRKEQAPLIEWLFQQLGALSVTLADAADDPLLEPAPGETPLWQRIRVTGLFSEDTDPDSLRESIVLELNDQTGSELGVERLEEQVWERTWMDNFQPMRFGQRLWICPGEERQLGEEAVVVALDPGLAFGTGTHPTTALCLEWLDSADLKGKQVIDFGCGSGVLSVAALRLGAAGAIAVDHDPQALQATAQNAERNQVLGLLDIRQTLAQQQESADLLLANILAGTLIDLEPLLMSLVKPGGNILLSGILPQQEDEVRARYHQDFEMGPTRSKDGWLLLQGVRRKRR